MQKDEQQRQEPQPEEQKQQAAANDEPAAAVSTCGEQQQQDRQPSPDQGNHVGPVVSYVRPLLSLEAHLFSNLLFALIADAAEQRPEDQEKATAEAAETVAEQEPSRGVPFAALPRLWQVGILQALACQQQPQEEQ